MDLYEYIDEMKAVQMETEKEDIGVEEIQIEW